MRGDYLDVHTWQELCTSGPYQYVKKELRAFCSSPACTAGGKAPTNNSNGVWIQEAKFTDTVCPRCNQGWPLYWAKVTNLKKKKQEVEEPQNE